MQECLTKQRSQDDRPTTATHTGMDNAAMKPVNTPPRSASLAEAAAESGSKLRRVAIVALIVIIAAVFTGLIPRLRQRTQVLADTQELSVPTVSVVSAKPGKSAATLSLPAEVKPFLDAPIYSRSSGYLTNWFFDIGAQVKQGDLLAEIDAPDLRQELVRARAELVQAQAALALSKITADRWAELVKTASVSEQEAAEKEGDFELKTANVAAARATVKRLEELQSFSHVRAPFFRDDHGARHRYRSIDLARRQGAVSPNSDHYVTRVRARAANGSSIGRCRSNRRTDSARASRPRVSCQGGPHLRRDERRFAHIARRISSGKFQE